jgi:uncharacterized protein with HEPN domain
VSLSPREYIRHILDEIDYILSQIPGLDFESFNRNPTLKRAFVRSLEITAKPQRRFRRTFKTSNPKSNGQRLQE